MVSQMVRPAAVTFLDTMLRDRDKAYRVDEVEISPGSPLAGRRLDASGVRDEREALLVALKREGDVGYVFNPPGDTMLQERDVLVFMTTPAGRQAIESRVARG
jgi:voltage-gated potassium channel